MTPASTISEAVYLSRVPTRELVLNLPVSKRRLDDWIARGRADLDGRPFTSSYATPTEEDARRVVSACETLTAMTAVRLRELMPC